MSVIARAPASPPALNPHDDRYYDPRDLEAELRRAFQICHECRMCVNYCGSFPEMFKRIDRDIESGKSEGAEHLDDADITAIADECWQCKLCYIKCPYTPDEGAKELLDFPRLLVRERAVRARREGIPLVDKILGEPQLVGEMGSGMAAPMANLITKNQLLRKVQEKVTGISAEFNLPPMAKETFTSWFNEHKPLEGAGEQGEVVLFATCYGEFNTPEVAKAAVLVLEHNGYKVRYPGAGDDADDPSLTCCGLPNIDGGDVAAASEKINHNVARLLPHVRAGRKIVTPGPSCGMMMKKEWREYVPRPEVAEVGAATLDLMEFLVTLGKEKKLKREFPTSLGKVAYHAACHLRAQKIGFPGQRVLNVVPETEVRIVEECSAVDGTWGMKAKHYDTGVKYAGRMVRGIAAAEADVVVSDCTLAGLRIEKENGVEVMHPVEALARAYGLIKGGET
ncbi:MAG: heterodisulfide reductase-related iron-sulfur binding cluster [Byssovorax sp.]